MKKLLIFALTVFTLSVLLCTAVSAQEMRISVVERIPGKVIYVDPLKDALLQRAYDGFFAGVGGFRLVSDEQGNVALFDEHARCVFIERTYSLDIPVDIAIPDPGIPTPHHLPEEVSTVANPNTDSCIPVDVGTPVADGWDDVTPLHDPAVVSER